MVGYFFFTFTIPYKMAKPMERIKYVRIWKTYLHISQTQGFYIESHVQQCNLRGLHNQRVSPLYFYQIVKKNGRMYNPF